MGGGGWKLGRIGGIEIRADSSVLFIAGLIVYSNWQAFANGAFPARTTSGTAIALAIAAAVLFFGSVLVHELGHAAVARARHFEVEGITLWMFGGATQTKADSRGPADEFLITVVGPATSLALGGVLLAVSGAMARGPGSELVRNLGQLNILLGVFNILPAYPMDGGRVLRAAIWAVTKSQSKATIGAARVGQAFGAAFVVLGATVGIAQQKFAYVWLATIGLLLLQAATATLRQERRTRTLDRTSAGDVMRPPPAAIPADMPIDAVRASVLNGRNGAFPVMDGSRLVGFVSGPMLEGMSGDRPVREVAASPDAAVTVGPSDPLALVVSRLNDGRASVALVLDDGRLVGVIAPDDVTARLDQRTRAGRS
jgi:Zn-dependent protease/predicted transcriptional regulator